MPLDKIYSPKSIESRWAAHWESKNYFQPNPKNLSSHHAAHKSYCIVIPPPNITGVLHMGHAFQDTLMDILTRTHRMMGDTTLWQMGTDHAGIATQMVVARQIAQQHPYQKTLNRQKLVDAIWDWKKQSGEQIQNQIRRLGASVDWSRERFTLDRGLSDAVQRCFIQLYDEGLIYRGKKLVNWDPVLKTAISDLEVVQTEHVGSLWHIFYALESDPTQGLTVATTRPETLFGDVAVAVHPDDPRYQAWIGQSVQLPLTTRKIPIIADSAIDMEFGTGCVKITPAHDFNDYEMAQRHQLPMISIFTETAHLNQDVPLEYQNLERFEARKKILDDLKHLNLLIKTEPYTHTIPRGDRSHAVIEPYLTSQWFVKMQSLAEPAIEAVRTKKIQFVPTGWENTYYDWMTNIQDWCISRQIWWGHRIPAWTDPDGQVYVANSEAQVREKYSLSPNMPLTQDPDVLDTWFSSALWPFSSLGWPNTEDPMFKQFYPTQVLVTGFDIIFYWVARMIMFGLKFTKQVPFSKVYIHGLILDAHGQKMSKTKGNVLDPIDLIDGISKTALIEKRTQNLMQPQMAQKISKQTELDFPEGIPAYGTDALRFTFCAMATTGRHIRFDLKRIEGYRNFCNKLWNAARFIELRTNASNSVSDSDSDSVQSDSHKLPNLSIIDRWMLSLWQTTKTQILLELESYRFDLLAHRLYDFVWHEFCDWYLELSKYPSTDSQNSPEILKTIFYEILKTLHPIIPFITEEIWHTLEPEQESIMIQAYPKPDATQLDSNAVAQVDWLKQLISCIRTLRSENNIAPGQKLTVFLQYGKTLDLENFTLFEPIILALGKLKTLTWLTDSETPPQNCLTGLAGSDLQVLIPYASLANDPAAEKSRLEKTMGKLKQNLAHLEQKLNNPNYTQKAPESVVSETQRQKLELENSIAQLQQKVDMVSNL